MVLFNKFILVDLITGPISNVLKITPVNVIQMVTAPRIEKECHILNNLFNLKILRIVLIKKNTATIIIDCVVK